MSWKTPKKTPKGQLTRGQHAEKVRMTVSSRFHETPPTDDIPENTRYRTDDVNEDLKLAETEIAIQSQNLCGILWLTQTTSFDSFPLVSFTDEQMKTNAMKVQKICNDISLKFASKYHEIFSETVMGHWASWLQNEKARWDPNLKRNTHAQLQIPDAFLSRANLVDAADSDDIVVDSAPLEFEDSIEYLTNDSKSYG